MKTSTPTIIGSLALVLGALAYAPVAFASSYDGGYYGGYNSNRSNVNYVCHSYGAQGTCTSYSYSYGQPSSYYGLPQYGNYGSYNTYGSYPYRNSYSNTYQSSYDRDCYWYYGSYYCDGNRYNDYYPTYYRGGRNSRGSSTQWNCDGADYNSSYYRQGMQWDCQYRRWY
jgi:hypothetical protein